MPACYTCERYGVDANRCARSGLRLSPTEALVGCNEWARARWTENPTGRIQDAEGNADPIEDQDQRRTLEEELAEVRRKLAELDTLPACTKPGEANARCNERAYLLSEEEGLRRAIRWNVDMGRDETTRAPGEETR